MPSAWSAKCPCNEAATEKGMCPKFGDWLPKKATSKEGAQSIVVNHRTSSPYHKMNDENAKTKAEDDELCCYKSVDYSEEEWNQWLSEQAAKKGGKKREAQNFEHMQSELRSLRSRLDDRDRGPVTSSAIGAMPHASSASSGGAPMVRFGGFNEDDTIGLRRSELRTLCDCVNRAASAAMQAATVCKSAAAGFDAEASALQQALTHIQSKLI